MRGQREIKIRLSETKRVLAGHWKTGYNLERLWGYHEALEWVLEERKGKFKGCKKHGRGSYGA